MGPMEDKLVKAKIDSLHTLPEGYAPSLGSKWELLQAGLEGTKRKRPVSRIAIAAGIILLAGLGWIGIRTNTGNEAPAVAKGLKQGVLPAAELPLQDHVTLTKASPAPTAVKPDHHSFTVLPPKGKPGELSNENELSMIPPQDTSVLNEDPMGAKRIARDGKIKFLELEFNDPPDNAPYMEARADAGIRIKLMPQQHIPPQSDASSSVKLKRSF
jgi:hypothetical protein